MSDESIRHAWRELDRLFGPPKSGILTARKNSAQVYALAVLEAADADRIKCIGKKHLQLAAEKILDGSQLSSFLMNVIAYER
ncbi:MAG: hypothetical protein PHG96_07805 [Kiritimatiellae bacterium]|nr:hypothetical protein [Kiritimatiellia bacterium]MDD3545245.1 hypothetical protein [Kiritimatiellia bacterium]MDD4622866.1 hypothetical protein [Kiritimatiellia bacterium]